MSLFVRPSLLGGKSVFWGKATQQKYPHGVTMNTEYKHLVISFIFAEIYIYTLYLNSLATVKKHTNKQKRKKISTNTATTITKIQDRRVGSQMFRFLYKILHLHDKVQRKSTWRKIHSHHKLCLFFFVKFKKNSSILFLQTVLTCPNCNVYNFSYIKKKQNNNTKVFRSESRM